MSQMVHHITMNETVLMEQYANDKSPGWGARGRGEKPPKAKTLLASGRLMEAANLPAFKYPETQKITDICSLHDPRSFSLTFQK